MGFIILCWMLVGILSIAILSIIIPLLGLAIMITIETTIDILIEFLDYWKQKYNKAKNKSRIKKESNKLYKK